MQLLVTFAASVHLYSVSQVSDRLRLHFQCKLPVKNVEVLRLSPGGQFLVASAGSVVHVYSLLDFDTHTQSLSRVAVINWAHQTAITGIEFYGRGRLWGNGVGGSVTRENQEAMGIDPRVVDNADLHFATCSMDDSVYYWVLEEGEYVLIIAVSLFLSFSLFFSLFLSVCPQLFALLN